MDLKNVVSATKSMSCCSSFFLLLFTFYLSSFLTQAARNPPPKEIYHVLNLSSLQPKSYCESRSTAGSSSLESGTITMASRYGPCSWDWHKRGRRIPLSSHSSHDDKEDVLEYYLTVGLGTPKTDYHLLVDTGSDITWVRCQPCTQGCQSRDPLFDPLNSSTYVNQSCRSGDDKIKPSTTYGDNSTFQGNWGCDTLTIEEPSYVVKKFQFVCAHKIVDTVGDNFGNDGGILGLGRGLSLASQAKFKMFGYCIPKTNSRLGYFVFGRKATEAKMSSSFPQFTPLIYDKSYYYVKLNGISVDGKKLGVDPSVFSANGSLGTIIDSGTSFTQLPMKAYSALTTSFNQIMASRYPIASDTCYNVTGFDASNIYVPPITFHFGGISKGETIEVELRQSGIFVLVPPSEQHILCLGFAQNDENTIIGNHQQRQMAMFFDLQSERIGFGTNNCAN